jgi:hypothetical protein
VCATHSVLYVERFHHSATRCNALPGSKAGWRVKQATGLYQREDPEMKGMPLKENSQMCKIYESVSTSFRTGRLERELQMVQLSATRYRCIAILSVSLVSFAAITLCVSSQRVFIVVSVYFVIDWVRKLLGTPSYTSLDRIKRLAGTETGTWSLDAISTDCFSHDIT